MELSPITLKSCQVCCQPCHGFHFGAMVCRACAAFFRRCAGGAKYVSKCREGSGTCKIETNGRLGCKKCRLEKCQEIGMDMKNFQFNRDPHRTTHKVIPSLAMFLGRPQFVLFCDPEAVSIPSRSTFIDLTELVKNSIKILTEPKKEPKKVSLSQNRLRKLSLALDLNRFTDTPEEEYKVITDIGVKEAISFFEHDLLLVSKWLSHFDEFQELSLEVRLTFLKSFWHIWNRLEKLGRTVMLLKTRKEKFWGGEPVLLADNCVLDVRKMKLDISWLSKYSVEQIGYYIEGVGDRSIFTPLRPLLDLNPSEIELNYMLAQLSFSYAAKKLPNEYSKLSEHFLELLADDLHVYYVKDLGISRYSDRISKMMKVNNTIMRIVWERREKMEIARTFNIFHVEYSEPEMFRDFS
ncbi:hypothetical protein CAEBREN_00299, partial [Caenorhabditis brenneri]